MQKELIATFWAKNRKYFWSFTQKDISKKLETLDDSQSMRLMTTSFSQKGWTALGVILLCTGALGCLIRTILSILNIYWYHECIWDILRGLFNPMWDIIWIDILVPHFMESIAIILLGIIVLCVIRKVYSLKKFFTLIDSMPNNIQNNEETTTEQATNN